MSKNSCVLPLRALNPDATLSINASSLELAVSNCLFPSHDRLALSKETLGQIRGKFGGSIPIPGDNVSLNASDLLSQANTEMTALREELNKQLDEMLYTKMAETDKTFVENTDAIVSKTPMKIFVG